MNETQIKSSMKDNRRKAIINAAFQIFVEKKIEPVSMGEIAEAAGVGRATLFRYYPNKLELVIAVCAAKWKEYLDALDAKRPLTSIGDIPAIDRFTFTLDSYIEMYQHHKDLLQYNDNFNHYVTHEKVDNRKNIIHSYNFSFIFSINYRPTNSKFLFPKICLSGFPKSPNNDLPNSHLSYKTEFYKKPLFCASSINLG